jgi:hypothetical protein
MLKFSEYFAEENGTLEIEKEQLEGQLDYLNADLDSVTQKPFQNSAVFINTIRGTLERYSLLIPSMGHATLSPDGEVVFKLGESGKFLYIVYDVNDFGFTEGYAQVVTNDELKDLSKLDSEDWMSNKVPYVPKKTPYAGRGDADDSGDNSDYT